MTVRHRRLLAASAAGVTGLVYVLLAAIRHPVISLDDVQVHLSEPADVASRFGLLAIGVGLLASVRGLRRGNRRAWDVAMLLSVVSVVVLQTRDADALGVVCGVTSMAALLAARGACRSRSERPSIRRGVVTLIVGSASVYVYGVIGLFALDTSFSTSTTFARSLVDAAIALFWLPRSFIGPHGSHAQWFVDSVRVLGLGVLAASVAMIVRASRTSYATATERARAAEILEAHGSTSLAYFTLLSDKLYVFSADGHAYISYKVVGNVAVALGDPVGRRESLGGALDAFLARCSGEGLEPALHQATGDHLDLYTSKGMSSTAIGDEAVIDVQAFTIDTPSMKSVRNKTNKLRRVGVVVEELSEPIDAVTMDELRAVSDDWLASGGHRERSFTLGAFDEDYLRNTTVLVARSPGDSGGKGRIEAFVNVLPSFQGTDGNFDLMRRRRDAPNNVMDLLFVEMIERFRGQGLSGMALGLAPLTGITGDTAVDRSKRQIYERGERAFNFQGLYDFKNKWSPRWDARYLVYRHELALPKVAAAIAAAGEHDSPVTRHPYRPAARAAASSIGTRFASTLMDGTRRRRDAWPFAAVIAVVLTGQIATTGRPTFHARLIAVFGNSWDDLVSFRWLRLTTSSLIQADVGVRPGIVVLLIAACIVVAYRVDGRRALILWFAVDAVSSVTLFVGYRVLADLGWARGLVLAATRDAGSSSAAHAVIAAGILSLDNARVRWGGLIVLILGQIPILVITQNPAYVGHVIAIAATVGLVVPVLDRRRPVVTETAQIESLSTA